GASSCQVLDSGHDDVLAHTFSGPHGAMLFLHNLDEHERTVELGDQVGQCDRPAESFADAEYAALDGEMGRLKLNRWGYRWIRLRFTP
ncbi:MAG: hypothetical protein ABR573_02735, partial [Candidatus Dormibacteria bacterium]